MGHPAISVGDSAQKLAPATLGLLRNTRHLSGFTASITGVHCARSAPVLVVLSRLHTAGPPGQEIGEPDFQRFASSPTFSRPHAAQKIGDEGSPSIQFKAKEKEHGKCDR
jgi:hypothetical protein